MEKCTKCTAGLIHQGESISYTCPHCLGTGLVETLPIVQDEEVEIEEEESFLAGASEESSGSSED